MQHEQLSPSNLRKKRVSECQIWPCDARLRMGDTQKRIPTFTGILFHKARALLRSLLQHHHPLRLDIAPGGEAVEVNATGEVARIELNRMLPGALHAIHQRC